MQNIISEVSSTIDKIEQINNAGMSTHILVAITIMCIVIPIAIRNIFKIARIYKELDNMIDKRIEAKMGDSIEILKDTVCVVKNLEKNTAEMNATLSILKEILLSHKIS